MGPIDSAGRRAPGLGAAWLGPGPSGYGSGGAQPVVDRRGGGQVRFVSSGVATLTGEIRHPCCVRTMTAAEVSRNFAAVLEAVERGETVTVTRGDRAVAEMRPAGPERFPPPEGRFGEDTTTALGLISGEGGDPSHKPDA
jgi:antitoxin (DNA-binding transcriptional repressor) of toxin-antitoxin stability system